MCAGCFVTMADVPKVVTTVYGVMPTEYKKRNTTQWLFTISIFSQKDKTDTSYIRERYLQRKYHDYYSDNAKKYETKESKLHVGQTLL